MLKYYVTYITLQHDVISIELNKKAYLTVIHYILVNKLKLKLRYRKNRNSYVLFLDVKNWFNFLTSYMLESVEPHDLPEFLKDQA